MIYDEIIIFIINNIYLYYLLLESDTQQYGMYMM